MSAAEILGRTRGSAVWGGIYGLFVACVSVHAALGLATILREWGPLSRRSAAMVAHAIGALLFILGLRAVYAVVF